MKSSNELTSMYRDYYHDQNVLIKRRISAQQTVMHIRSLLPGYTYQSLIDIGAGDGSVLVELDKTSICRELHAVEISESGCASIKDKNIRKVQSINQFNGYHVPVEDGRFELGLAVHVLEHVEHERAFLHEISRICDFLYIEVPLELSVKLPSNIIAGRGYGHINFYNQALFKNLLITSGLEILNYKTFAASIDYENHVSNWPKGPLKHFIKSSALKCLPSFSERLFTYMAGAYCKVNNRHTYQF